MGEFVLIVCRIKRDKNYFKILMDKMDPLINKYIRLLYKDDKEDIRAEMYLALWEAVVKISYYESDGQIINFLNTSLRNRFLELYKSSKQHYAHEIYVDEMEDLGVDNSFHEDGFNDVIIKEDCNNFIEKYYGTKKRIVYMMLIESLTDSEIAQKMQMSRQYINRIRRCVRNALEVQRD